MIDAELLAMLFQRLPQGVALWRLAEDERLILLTANGAASAALATDLDSLTGHDIGEIFPALTEEQRRRYVDLACGAGDERDKRGEPTILTDRRVTSGTFSVVAIPLGVGQLAILFENLTEQKRTARQIRTLNAFLDSIIENIPAMVFVKDAETLSFERFNRAGEDLLGVSRAALLGKNDFDFFPADQAQFFQSKDREVLRCKKLLDVPEEPIQTPRGERWLHTKKIPILDAAGEPRHLLGISEDITDRKQAEEALRQAHRQLEQRVAERTTELVRANAELTQQIADRMRAEAALRQSEEQLRRSQKLEAIGRLAGGIAHDFNNLLSIILSYSEMVVAALEPTNPLRDDVRQIGMAGERARQLTRQLLAFSRQQVLQPEVLDLNSVVQTLEPMLRRVLGENIALHVLPRRSRALVKADPGQIEQIILNLVVNARDAMPSGGQLTILTEDLRSDGDGTGAPVACPSSAHVQLTVCDTGVGMDDVTKARLFEPFFTTKEAGKGTGLGLSTVFGIVQQSGGQIAVTSAPGAGATFAISLPCTAEQPQLRGPAAPSSRALGGAETILLVEDEPQLRALAREILRRNGYNVLESEDVNHAIRISQHHAGVIDLLLTDVVMPLLGGRELAERLVPSHPSMRVLYMSGYTDDAIVSQGGLEPGVAFLQKPITPELLAEKVRQVLDGPAKRTGAPVTDPRAPAGERLGSGAPVSERQPSR